METLLILKIQVLIAWCDRAAIEEEYAKRMNKLARQSLGKDENR